MSQTITRHPSYSKTHLQFQGISCGICYERSSSVTVFSLSTSFIHCRYHSTNILYSIFICLLLELGSLGGWLCR